jgi:hypothetical protein
MGTIYRKTPIGQTEIETRALRLLPRMRNLLIMVDGRRDVDALQALLGYEPTAALRELLAYGLIEAAAQRLSSVATAGGDSAPTTQPAGLDPSSLAQLRKAAVRALNDALGPAAETTAIRIERASTEADLRALLERAASTIAAVRGAAAGRAFAERFTPKG